MSSKANFIEKLRGRENYDVWKISAKSYLVINGYWSCTTSEATDSSTDAIRDKHDRALSEITLMIEPSLYPYIEGLTSAKQAWEALASAFADTGACRKVSILQQWIAVKLNDYGSMEEYVNSMTNLWNKVKSVGFKIDEEVAASLLLAGLPTEYRPMILAIENTQTADKKLTMDFVKNLLLQGSTMDSGSKDGASALFVKNKRKFNKFKHRKVKCFTCGGPHFAKKCPNKRENTETSDIVLMTSLLSNNSPSEWIIDSGASAHMANTTELFINNRDPIKSDVLVANNQRISVKCSGDVKQKVMTKQGTNEIVIKNVQHVPELCGNLLSVSQIVKNNNTVVFTSSGCTIYNADKKVIATGNLVNNLFKLNTALDYAYSAKNVLWHRRFAHISPSNMGFLKQQINGIDSNKDLNCVTCAEGKMSRKPFSHESKRASTFLELVHSDVCGPMSVKSIGGSRYFVTFIDDFSRKVFVYMLANKSQVYDTFIKFKAMVETQTGSKIKILRTDNGTEYCNRKFDKFLETAGIQHQTSCTYTPQQNGVSERFNRTIAERARCMMFDRNISKGFWAEAVSTAVKIINSTPSSVTKQIPDEMWFKKPVDFSAFKVFGCKCMVMIQSAQRKKLDKRAIECIFVGYAEDQKGYRFYNPKTKKNSNQSRCNVF